MCKLFFIDVTRYNLTVPSGVFSAYQTSEKDDIFFSYNDIKLRWLGNDNWYYKTTVNGKWSILTNHVIIFFFQIK